MRVSVKFTENSQVFGANFKDVQVIGGGNGANIVVDNKMSETSTNPVQNKVVKAYIDEQNNITKGMASSAGQMAQQAKQKAEYAESVAKGRATGYVFDTYNHLTAWLSVDVNRENLVFGDNLYIRDVGVPDYWWDGTNIYPLETQKVDLTEYAKKENIPTTLSQLGEDDIHRLVTDEEKQIWNSKLGQSDLENATNEALSKAKESGEFDGKDGVDGKTPYISNGYWHINGVNTGVKAQGVNGKDGSNGTNGKDGADGYTPIKGTDYFTETDKDEMVSAVITALPKYNGEAVTV